MTEQIISLTGTLTGIVPINHGGTGHTFRTAALNGLLPSQVDKNGKVLGTNGVDALWVDAAVVTETPSPISSGLYVDMPMAGVEGRVYIATDSLFNWYDNGTAWAPFGPRQFVEPANLPVIDDFDLVHEGNATIDDTHGGIYLQSMNSSGLQILEQEWSTNKTLLVYGCITGQITHNNGWAAGITLRDPDTNDKVLLNGMYNENVIQIGALGFNDLNSGYSKNFAGNNYSIRPCGHYVWYKLQDNGTQTIFSVSVDGVTFERLYTIGNTFHLGVVATKVGFATAWSFADPLSFHVLSWNIS